MLTSLARTRTNFSRRSWVALPYDQTSFSPHEPIRGLHVPTSGSEGPLRQPWVRKIGEKSPNSYQRTMSSRMYGDELG